MNYIIITGTSKGLGEAISLRLISPQNHIFCISRKKNNNIIYLAKQKGYYLDYYEFDLNNLEDIDELVKDIFSKIKIEEAESICLINNAGVLQPIMPIEKCKSVDIISSFKVNSIAPIVLAAQFIQQSEGINCKRAIINISSGAGKNPYYGWSCYCSTKAAIDMFTRTVGIEQSKCSNPTKIISFAPGIMDTDMQKEIRASEVEDFEQVEKFIKYKEDGKLLTPDFVAEKVIELLNSEEIEQGAICDIKEFITSD